jgi:hypothetical protein
VFTFALEILAGVFLFTLLSTCNSFQPSLSMDLFNLLLGPAALARFTF